MNFKDAAQLYAYKMQINKENNLGKIQKQKKKLYIPCRQTLNNFFIFLLEIEQDKKNEEIIFHVS